MSKNHVTKYFLFVLISSVLAFLYFFVKSRYPIAEPTFPSPTPVSVPSPITISGKYTCLPKKDTGKPVTLECALGLQTNTGYYALDTSGILSSNYPALISNENITVEGYLVPIEMVSSDRFQIYDNLIGIISVEKITK